MIGAAGWRFAALAGAAGGLALSPLLAPGDQASTRALAVLGVAAGIALAASPRGDGRGATATRLALAALVAACAGVLIGSARLAAIDAGAMDGPPGATAVRGFVAAVPRRSQGDVRVRVETPAGRLLVQAHEPVPDLPVGREVRASGSLRAPRPWEEDYLARYGIRRVLVADRVTLTSTRRGGLTGFVDGVRDRAEQALGEGTPEPEAALLRGFVLGEDDRVDPATVTDFKRSGLAHLLAVSGENVILLVLLAVPLLAALGLRLRTRLVGALVLIAIYVPVTGAGPSIQRAGVMGAAGIVAALADRPRSRWYAILLAALVTLALNPRVSGDVGWQLSFAAVVGIMLWASGFRSAVLGALARGAEPGEEIGWRRSLAEGAGVTIAATLATAPLMAHAFGAVSLASLPANLLALPAVAPLMWLGMLAAIAGQLPLVPVAPITALAGLLAAYVAQVAHWMGSPGWAQAQLALPGAGAVLGAYTMLAAAVGWLLGLARRRAGLGGRGGARRPGLRAAGLLALAGILAALAWPAFRSIPPAPGLRVTVLDVGQGDAILLDPADGDPVLVDGGPPGDDLASLLEDEGATRLAAALVTHDQADHFGGIAELLGSVPVHALVYGEPAREVLGAARRAGVRALAVAEGSEVDSGSLRLEVLWPPRALVDASHPGEDPNRLALVVLARWHGFRMLLTADAEAEAVPIDPGPLDVLKVAHHGSEDAGLGALLDRTVPGLAVISVGAENPYGHPSPATLATLADHGVPALRTDLAGDVTIDVTDAGWSVAVGG